MAATPNELAFLKSQLLAVQRLLHLATDHPLMSAAFSCRESELCERIREAEESMADDRLLSCRSEASPHRQS